MQITRKILSGLLFTFFVGGMFVSLFHFSAMIDGGVPMGSDCPFASHGEAVCPMDFMAHIGAWKDTFVAVVPEFVGIVLLASLLAAVISLAPNLLGQSRYFVPRFLGHVRERTYTFIYRFWQELFSSGILHPKLF